MENSFKWCFTLLLLCFVQKTYCLSCTIGAKLVWGEVEASELVEMAGCGMDQDKCFTASGTVSVASIHVEFIIGQCGGNLPPTCETMDTEAEQEIITALGTLNVTGNVTRTFLSCNIVNCTGEDCNAPKFKDEMATTTTYEITETTDEYSGNTPTEEQLQTTGQVIVATTEILDKATPISDKTTESLKTKDSTASGTVSKSSTVTLTTQQGDNKTVAVTASNVTEILNSTEDSSVSEFNNTNGANFTQHSTPPGTMDAEKTSKVNGTIILSTPHPTMTTESMTTTKSEGVKHLATVRGVFVFTIFGLWTIWCTALY